MKKLFFFALLFMAFTGAAAQNKPAATNPEYDAALAKKLGADEYGMKQYVMAFLKDGPNRITDSVKRADFACSNGPICNVDTEASKLAFSACFICLSII
jgi:hypothetical protein